MNKYMLTIQDDATMEKLQSFTNVSYVSELMNKIIFVQTTMTQEQLTSYSVNEYKKPPLSPMKNIGLGGLNLWEYILEEENNTPLKQNREMKRRQSL